MRLVFFLAATAVFAFAQDKYDGPRPPKPDVPYLLHASKLIETETLEAKEETRKKDQVASIPGKASPVKTPLSEPIFLVDANKMVPSKLQLYRLDVTKDGRREVIIPDGSNKKNRPIHVVTKKVSGNLYRVEVDETLENGEYCLSPEGSSAVYCFAIY